jgi:VWFA-related protein
MISTERRFGSHPIATCAALIASFCSLAGVTGSYVASAQQPAGQTTSTMSVQVNVVNVLATVRDKHGKIVNDLSKEDFTLTEDSRPQTIRYFTRDTDLPLSLGLLVDTSLSQTRVLDKERSASHSFLDQMVREDKDKAFVIHFDREVELLQDFTPSHQKLEAALEQLQAPHFAQTSGGNSPDPDSGSGRGSGRRGNGGGGTHLYDAVYLATDESDGLMSKQQGRKALIILSDGVDRGSKETLDGAITSAQRADTIVYSILFKDDEGYGNQGGFGGPRIGMGGGGMGGPMGGGGMGRRGGGYPSQQQRPDGKKILEQISRQTGGRLFEVSKKQPIDDIYAQIEEELRNQYSLGYTPDRGGAAAEGYHKIQLTTNRKDAVVLTREGYYAAR